MNPYKTNHSKPNIVYI